MPILSITIPTRNRANLLGELLESIHANDCRDLEVVVADNASSDHTCEVVSQYAARENAPRYVYLKHSTMLSFDLNVNSTVEAASGDYVWLMGDDDKLRPDAVEKINAFLETGKYVSGVVNYADWNADFSQCYLESVFPCEKDLIEVSLEELLRPTNFFFSFLSIHVVSRTAWLRIDRSRFLNERLDCIHFLLPLQIGVQGKNFLISEVLLDKRTSSYDVNYLDSTDIVGSWYRTIQVAVESGVSRDVADIFYRKYINDWHLSRDLILKKMRRSPRISSDSAFVWRVYRRFPQFWLKVLPIILLPAPILRFIHSSYKYLKSKIVRN